MESFAVEGTYKSLEFTSSTSGQLWNGYLHRENETIGVIFVAEKLYTTGRLAGARDQLTVDNGEIGVIIYNCEKIQVPKAAGVAFNPGDAVYWDGIHLNGVTPVFASGLYWIGICAQAAVAADEQVLIDIHGNHAMIEAAP